MNILLYIRRSEHSNSVLIFDLSSVLTKFHSDSIARQLQFVSTYLFIELLRLRLIHKIGHVAETSNSVSNNCSNWVSTCKFFRTIGSRWTSKRYLLFFVSKNSKIFFVVFEKSYCLIFLEFEYLLSIAIWIRLVVIVVNCQCIVLIITFHQSNININFFLFFFLKFNKNHF